MATKRMKLTGVESRAKGVRLGRNVTLVAGHQPDDRWPKAAHRLYNRLSKAGARGSTLFQLAHNDRYDRWMVRCLVKAKHIRPLARVTRIHKRPAVKHEAPVIHTHAMAASA